jgi:hypothetical protein
MGCFLDRPRPATFRNDCDADRDCRSGEICLQGLCEVPCTQATASDDCPSDTYVACLNGACANTCQLDADKPCPGAQACLDLGLGGEGSYPGGGGSEPVGLCTALCTSDPPTCPTGEVCLEGLCAQSCATPEDCGDGLTCVLGVCVPDTGGSGSGATGSGSAGGSSGSGSGSSGGGP